jgi:hypothetical protein
VIIPSSPFVVVVLWAISTDLWDPFAPLVSEQVFCSDLALLEVRYWIRQ